ncbi:hypothetical protein Tco_0826195 [Tanacetum coccineum]
MGAEWRKSQQRTGSIEKEGRKRAHSRAVDTKERRGASERQEGRKRGRRKGKRQGETGRREEREGDESKRKATVLREQGGQVREKKEREGEQEVGRENARETKGRTVDIIRGETE